MSKLYEVTHIVGSGPNAPDEDHVRILREGPVGGPRTTEMLIPMSYDAFKAAMLNWQIKRTLVQEAFPTLTPDEREFLLTGHTPETWEALFSQSGKGE